MKIASKHLTKGHTKKNYTFILRAHVLTLKLTLSLQDVNAAVQVSISAICSLSVSAIFALLFRAGDF